MLLQYEKTLGEEASSLKLVSSIEKNAHHYLDILSRAVDKVMPEAQTAVTYVALPRAAPSSLMSSQVQGRPSRCAYGAPFAA